MAAVVSAMPTTGQAQTSKSSLNVRVFNPVNMMFTPVVIKYPVSGSVVGPNRRH